MNLYLSGLTLICLAFVSPSFALASNPALETTTTKVGNGDDGADLEHKEKVTSGILEMTRQKASEHLKQLGAKNIPHLGNLTDEVERTEIYLVHQNIQVPKDFDRGQEVSPDGRYVYARTFARPYAATRFFPAALMLSEQQLINLHIHEALHRSLPESVREDESVVSEITLALTDPKASFDSAKAVTVASVENAERRANALSEAGKASGYSSNNQASGENRSSWGYEEPKVTERLKRPSFFRYGYASFDRENRNDGRSTPILGMHRLDSYLHPFGRGANALGLGLSFSYVVLADKNYLGPLQISARYLLATWREFDVEAFAEQSLYTLSDEEMKSLPQARDTTTVGISMRRDGEFLYSENFLSYTLPSEAQFNVGNAQYKQRYGNLVNASLAFGGRYKALSAGVRGDLLLSQGFTVDSTSGSFSQEADRVRIVKFGPEIGLTYEALQWKLFAYQVIDGTPGASLDDVADLMGHGSGQGYAGSSLAVQF